MSSLIFFHFFFGVNITGCCSVDCRRSNCIIVRRDYVTPQKSFISSFSLNRYLCTQKCYFFLFVLAVFLFFIFQILPLFPQVHIDFLLGQVHCHLLYVGYFYICFWLFLPKVFSFTVKIFLLLLFLVLLVLSFNILNVSF